MLESIYGHASVVPAGPFVVFLQVSLDVSIDAYSYCLVAWWLATHRMKQRRLHARGSQRVGWPC
jgi:hypothetical protein